jgi:adenylate kinase
MIPEAEATHESFDLILVGGPGSGKGTQAEKLQAHLGLTHIASGDLFRENLNNETSLGQLAKRYMDRGELVPDDVTEAMVEERLARSDVNSGFILDGFPRTLSQAHALTEILNAGRRRIDGVIYIRVSDSEIVRRISGRLICRECQTPYHADFKPPESEGICDRCDGALYQRDDDNAETIRARLKTFHSQTVPIVEYYRNAGLLMEIDGEGPLDEVVLRTRAVADGLRAAAGT